MLEKHTWNPSLDLGHEAMDHDHHTQIALVSAFVDAVQQGRPWMATRLVTQLVQYSTVHFGSEELLMDASAYPGTEGHAREHRDLLGDLEALRTAHQSGDATLALSMAIDFRTALAAHMASADRRLAEHAASSRAR